MNHWKILEIPENSNLDAIKSSYRKLAKLYHPDVNKSDSATKLFIQINQSYEWLLDYNKKSNINNSKSTYREFDFSECDYSDFFKDFNIRSKGGTKFTTDKYGNRIVEPEIIYNSYKFNLNDLTTPQSIIIKSYFDRALKFYGLSNLGFNESLQSSGVRLSIEFIIKIILYPQFKKDFLLAIKYITGRSLE